MDVGHTKEHFGIFPHAKWGGCTGDLSGPCTIVPGLGGRCLAENKDQLKFELIKIRLHGLGSQGPKYQF